MKAADRTGSGELQSRILHMVSFRLGSEEYGIDIMTVQEIIRIQEITRIPQMPPFIEGVINLRGNVLPVLDLRRRFDMETKEHDNESRIIVVRVDSRTLGVVVDSVAEVLRIRSDQIEPPPPVVAGVGREYLRGVGRLGDRLIIFLSLERVLSTEEKGSLSGETETATV